jgi:hypothetical protein
VSVDFDYARRLVRDHLLDRWRAEDGRLVVSPRGFEDATHWRVVVSAEPTDPTDPADDEPAPSPPPDLSGRAFLVDKATGAVSEASAADPRVAAMNAYGV